MKRQLSIFLILFGTLSVFAQKPTGFSFTQKGVTITDPDIVETIALYKGHLNTIPKTAKRILGTTKKEAQQLIFTPYVPFTLGASYTVVYKREIQQFHIPIPDDYEQLSVARIYPEAAVLPSNFLKWYIQFSKPVNASRMYEHIHITDADGAILDRTLLPLLNPLLSEDRTRLTLWVEPGRQKRDLGPNARLGAVFESGKKYRLVISGLKDHNGVLMPTPYSHAFTITAPDRTKPDVKNWELKTPNLGTRDPLFIYCNEILDYGSLQKAVHITTANGKEVSGVLAWSSATKSIQFTPSYYWFKGDYKVLFNKTLEDLSGNNLERLFDQDIQNNPVKYVPPLVQFSIN